MNSDVNAYKGLYLKTSQERLEKILKNIIVLESNPQDSTAIDGIHLDAHSLKGASKLMGYEQIGRIALLIEDFFNTYKENKEAVPADKLRAIKTSVESIVQCVKSLHETDNDLDLTSDADKIEALINKS